MRLCRFGEDRVGLVRDDRIIDVTRVPTPVRDRGTERSV
jgi:hypothetical protein